MRWWSGDAAAQPVVRTRRFNGYLDITDYGAVGDGVTDDRAAIQAALTAAAGGNKAVYVPAKSYLVRATGVDVPCLTLSGNDITVFGDGPSSEIFADDIGTSNNGINPKVMTSHVLQVSATSARILIKDLQFRGRNSPWGGVWPYDAACRAAIACADGFVSSHDVTLENLVFRNLYGFAVRTGGGGEYRWTIRDCTIFETTNGINVNGEETVYENCRALYCNGVECSGHRSRLINVSFVGGSGASMGGAGVPVEDSQVVGCSFKDLTQGSAIAVGGSTRTVVTDSTINGAPVSYHGIVMQNEGTFGVQSGPLLVEGNWVKTGLGFHGVWCKESIGSMIPDNQVDSTGDALLIQTTDVSATGNRLRGNAYDLELTSADRVRFTSDNILTFKGLSPGGSAAGGLLDFVGTGAPTVVLPDGATWCRTDGTGPNFYVRENGVWQSK